MSEVEPSTALSGAGLNTEDTAWKQLPTDRLRQAVTKMLKQWQEKWQLILTPQPLAQLNECSLAPS